MTRPPANALDVLVIEDHRDSGEMVCSLLEAWGHRAVWAADGLEAVDVIDRGVVLPDLILVDFAMPRMNGAQFVAHARALEATKRTPMVVMSASDDPGIPGVAGFLQKPLVFEALETITTRFRDEGTDALVAVLARLREDCPSCRAHPGEWCRRPDRRPAAALCDVRGG